MNSYLILSFVFIRFLDSWVESKEFCEAFHENNQKISNSYRYGGDVTEVTNNSDVVLIDLFIGNNSWRLGINKDSSGLTFMDPNRESGLVGKFFSNYPLKYSIAFYSCCCKPSPLKYTIGCFTFRIETNQWNLFIGLENITSFDATVKEDLLVAYVKGMPFAAFQTDFNDTFGDKIVFVEYNTTDYRLNAQAFDVQSFYDWYNTKVDAIYAKEFPLDKHPKMQFLNSVIGKFNLLSLFNLKQKGEGDNWGYVLIFEKDSKLLWCWTHHNSSISPDCTNGSNLLVDCSITIPTESLNDTTVYETEGESETDSEGTETNISVKPSDEVIETTGKPATGSKLWICVIIIVGIISVVLIIVVILFFVKKKEAKEVPQIPKTAESQLSAGPTSAVTLIAPSGSEISGSGGAKQDSDEITSIRSADTI